jgi:hypothetical protein
MSQKPTLFAAVFTAIGMTIGLLYTRGSFDGMGLGPAVLVVAIGLIGAFLYFGTIHLLLKQWDRWRAKAGR